MNKEKKKQIRHIVQEQLLAGNRPTPEDVVGWLDNPPGEPQGNLSQQEGTGDTDSILRQLKGAKGIKGSEGILLNLQPGFNQISGANGFGKTSACHILECFSGQREAVDLTQNIFTEVRGSPELKVGSKVLTLGDNVPSLAVFSDSFAGDFILSDEDDVPLPMDITVYDDVVEILDGASDILKGKKESIQKTLDDNPVNGLPADRIQKIEEGQPTQEVLDTSSLQEPLEALRKKGKVSEGDLEAIAKLKSQVELIRQRGKDAYKLNMQMHDVSKWITDTEDARGKREENEGVKKENQSKLASIKKRLLGLTKPSLPGKQDISEEEKRFVDKLRAAGSKGEDTCPVCEQKLVDKFLVAIAKTKENKRLNSVYEQQSRVYEQERAKLEAEKKGIAFEEKGIEVREPPTIDLTLLPKGEMDEPSEKRAVRYLSGFQAYTQGTSKTYPSTFDFSDVDANLQEVEYLLEKKACGIEETIEESVAKAGLTREEELEVVSLENQLALYGSVKESDVTSYVQQRLALQTAQDKINLCKTTMVSKEKSKAVEAFLESGILIRFSKYCKALGIKDLEGVYLSKISTRKAKVRFGIRCNASGAKKLDKVLSKGEKQAIAIAFFLATYMEDKQTIVLDEPYQYLDHNVGSNLQGLLKEIAKEIQVVVFTIMGA